MSEQGVIVQLSKNHWVLEDFSQRITENQWREILLEENDKIFFEGTARLLVAKRLGAGIIQISKRKREGWE